MHPPTPKPTLYLCLSLTVCISLSHVVSLSRCRSLSDFYSGHCLSRSLSVSVCFQWSVSLALSLSICLSIFLSLYLSVSLYLSPLLPSINPTINPSIHQSIHPSVLPSIRPCFTICRSVLLYANLSFYLFLCLSVPLSVQVLLYETQGESVTRLIAALKASHAALGQMPALNKCPRATWDGRNERSALCPRGPTRCPIGR